MRLAHISLGHFLNSKSIRMPYSNCEIDWKSRYFSSDSGKTEEESLCLMIIEKHELQWPLCQLHMTPTESQTELVIYFSVESLSFLQQIVGIEDTTSR